MEPCRTLLSEYFQKALHVMSRKKQLKDDGAPTKLKRVLSLFDLVMLGIGSTLGLGAYVLSGSIAKLQAGPAACLSFLIAAVSSFFSGKFIRIIENFILLGCDILS